MKKQTPDFYLKLHLFTDEAKKRLIFAFAKEEKACSLNNFQSYQGIFGLLFHCVLTNKKAMDK